VEQLAGAPAAAASGGNSVSALRGTGMPQAEPVLFPSFGSYFLDRLPHYGLALLFVGFALLVRLLLEPSVHGQVSYGFFLLAVVATALVADLWETFFALVLGFLVADYFFVDPPGFAIGTAQGWWGALIYGVTGLGVLWFMKSEHTAWQRTLDRDIAYVDRLAELDHARASRHQTPADRELLASIVDSARDAILSVTPQGRIATWNAAAERLLRFSPREAIGQPLALIVPPEHRAEQQRLFDQIHRGEPVAECQTVFHPKNGSPIAVSLTLSPVKLGSGELAGVSVIARGKSPR
jgi:PAS domain S-box-containing protein